MRKLWLALATALFVVLALPASAKATGPEPAMRADSWSFELFGTSFCYGTFASCDVTLAPEPAALATPVVTPDTRRVARVLGLTLCVAPAPTTGPACDLIWAYPQPAAPWRDYPEIRLLADLER